MDLDKLKCVIELGSTKINCVIAEASDENIKIIATSTTPSIGIHNGVIVNPLEAVKAIRSCLSNVENKANVVLKKVNVVLEMPEFSCTKLSKYKKIDGSKIQKDDIVFLLKEAKKEVNINDKKRTIIHIFNHNYVVDGKKFIKKPIGVYADHLSHEMTFITMPKNNIKNIIQAFTNCDIEVERFISCTFALAIELLNHNDLFEGSILVDFGFEKTSLGLFKSLALVNSFTLPIGINHFIKDLSKVCSLTLEESSNIIKQIDFSFQNNNQFFDEKDFLKKNYFNYSSFRKISKFLILSIIKARIEEISEILKKQIILTGFNPNFGNKFFLVGGGSNLNNINLYFSNFFGSEVKNLGQEIKAKEENESIENFASCFGAFKLIKNGWETEAIPQIVEKSDKKKSFLSKIFSNQ